MATEGGKATSMLPIIWLWVGSVALYVVGLAIYRLIFHPLARYPGPKFAALTKWYECYFDLVKGMGGQYAFEIERMHEKYGPIVRVNPDEVHIKAPEWYETLYTHSPAKRHKWVPAASMTGQPLSVFGTVSHDTHRKRRSGTNAFFSKRAVNEAEPILQRHVLQMFEELKEACRTQNPVVLHVMYLAYAQDTISSAGFGGIFNIQGDDQRAIEWSDAISSIADMTPVAKQFPWLIGFSKKIPMRLIDLMSPTLARTSMQELALQFLSEKNSSTEKTSHISSSLRFYESIYNSSLPAEEKTKDRLGQEGFGTFAAAGETTARVLANGTFFILSNSEVVARLQSELKAAIPGRDDMPSLKTLTSLPYLTAVIKESLRCAAINTSRLPLVSDTPLVFEKWTIPANTPVSMTPRDILLDETIFPNSKKFLPERWLLEDMTLRKDLERYQVWFSKGSRMCPGLDYAWAEISMAIAIIFRRFNLEIFDTSKERDVDVARDCFVGMPVKTSVGPKIRVVEETTN